MISGKGTWENFAILMTGAIIIVIGILILATVTVNSEALAQSTGIFYVLGSILLIVGILAAISSRLR